MHRKITTAAGPGQATTPRAVVRDPARFRSFAEGWRSPADTIVGMEPTDLGRTSSIDVLRERCPLAGRHVIDIGCGSMTFSRLLAGAGASVLAVEPDDERAAANRAADLPPDVAFRQAGATDLPADDASADGACFSFSLHHVSEADHAAAFDEVRRVLRPGGWLCVIEPTGGPLNDIMRLYDDEDPIRAAAQRSLTVHARPHFASHAAFAYHSIIEYASFDDYASRHGGGRLGTATPASRRLRARVAEAFGRSPGPPHRFESRKRLDLLLGR